MGLWFGFVSFDMFVSVEIVMVDMIEVCGDCMVFDVVMCMVGFVSVIVLGIGGIVLSVCGFSG